MGHRCSNENKQLESEHGEFDGRQRWECLLWPPCFWDYIKVEDTWNWVVSANGWNGSNLGIKWVFSCFKNWREAYYPCSAFVTLGMYRMCPCDKKNYPMHFMHCIVSAIWVCFYCFSPRLHGCRAVCAYICRYGIS